MYTRKLVVCHDENGFFIGILEQDPTDSYIGAEGWITRLDDIPEDVDPLSDSSWFKWMDSEESQSVCSYDGYTSFTDGVYYV